MGETVKEKIKRLFDEGKTFEEVREIMKGECKAQTVYTIWNDLERESMKSQVKDELNPLMSVIQKHENEINRIEAVQKAMDMKIDELLESVKKLAESSAEGPFEKLVPIEVPESLSKKLEEEASKDEEAKGDISKFLFKLLKGVPLRETIQSALANRGKVVLRINNEGKAVVTRDLSSGFLIVGVVLGSILTYLVSQVL